MIRRVPISSETAAGQSPWSALRLVRDNPGWFGLIRHRDDQEAQPSRRAGARHDGSFYCGLKGCAASCSRPEEGGGREQNAGGRGKAASVGRRRCFTFSR
jgi:hypothetical protein